MKEKKRPILKLKSFEQLKERLNPVPVDNNFFCYCIYGTNQVEHPAKYVVRKWQLINGVEVPFMKPTAVTDSLREARLAVPFGLEMTPRHPTDDRSIIETWL